MIRRYTIPRSIGVRPPLSHAGFALCERAWNPRDMNFVTRSLCVAALVLGAVAISGVALAKPAGPTAASAKAKAKTTKKKKNTTATHDLGPDNIQKKPVANTKPAPKTKPMHKSGGLTYQRKHATTIP